MGKMKDLHTMDRELGIADERARRERLRELFWIPVAMGALIGVPIAVVIFTLVHTASGGAL